MAQLAVGCVVEPQHTAGGMEGGRVDPTGFPHGDLPGRCPSMNSTGP